MPERKTRPPLSEAQLEVMNVIWELGEAKVVDVWRILHDQRGLARNTVLTVMTRLEERGWLRRRPKANAFIYRPTVTKQKAAKGLLKNLLKTMFSGATDQLVVTLLKEKGVSTNTVDRIQKMIVQAQAKRKK